MDQIDAAIGMTEVAPELRQGWAWVSYLYMSIGEFDKARDFPLLWKKLTAQGIDRPEARMMPYRCER